MNEWRNRKKRKESTKKKDGPTLAVRNVDYLLSFALVIFARLVVNALFPLGGAFTIIHLETTYSND
jgi:hypothetical protein